MTPIEAHLKAYDLLDMALKARTSGKSVEAMRPDLEVLPREDLVMVAMALTVEAALVLTPRAERGRLHRRVQARRVEAMWAGS